MSRTRQTVGRSVSSVDRCRGCPSGRPFRSPYSLALIALAITCCPLLLGGQAVRARRVGFRPLLPPIAAQQTPACLGDGDYRSAVSRSAPHHVTFINSVLPHRKTGARSAPHLHDLLIGPWCLLDPFDQVENQWTMNFRHFAPVESG
jgi:hypothetical protein